MKLGFVGIGLMGRPMTLRLLAAGHEVAVWNRSREKLAAVLEKGARGAESPAAVARAAEIVMMCVTDQRAAEEVLFGRDGVAEGARRGAVVVDFSSIAPASARDFSKRLLMKDAPVPGGVPGAGQTTKLCNQIIVGSLLLVIAEAVRLAEAAGVDARKLPEALRGGFAAELGVKLPMAARALERYRELEAAGGIEREPSVLVKL